MGQNLTLQKVHAHPVSENLRTVHISTLRPSLTCDHLIKVTYRESAEAGTCAGPVCMVWIWFEVNGVGIREESPTAPAHHPLLSCCLPLALPPICLLSQPTLIYTGASGSRISLSDTGQLPHVLKIDRQQQ